MKKYRGGKKRDSKKKSYMAKWRMVNQKAILNHEWWNIVEVR